MVQQTYTTNHLRYKSYLISEKLELSLETGKNLVEHNDEKNFDTCVYLVMFRVLNTEKNTLVYKYIRYNSVFKYTLLYYLMDRSTAMDNIYKEPGFFLNIIDDKFFSEHTLDNSDIWPGVYQKFGESLKDILDNISDDIIYEQCIKLINKLTYPVNYDTMFILLNNAYSRNYDNFIHEIFGQLKVYPVLKAHLIDKPKPTISILTNCLFVVDNLNTFIQVVNADKNKLSANSGPQRHRGSINSLDNYLALIDTDYRKALFNHNNFHSNRNSRIKKLDKYKFSFNNVHMNIGNIR